MLRSPNKASSSNPDLSTITEPWINTNLRKRKQPEDNLCDMFTSFQAEMKNSLLIIQESMDQRLGRIDGSINSIKTDLESYVSEIKTEIKALRCDHNQLVQEVSSIKESLQFHSDNQDVITKRIDKLSSCTATLETNNSLIFTLQNKIDSLEQHARQCNLEISNVPEKKGENLISLLEKIGGGVGCLITHKDVISIHRVPHASKDISSPKNIIARLSSRILRDNVLGAFRLRKGLNTEQIGMPGTPRSIYLNEHLTLQNKKLFRQTREAAKQNKFKFVWVKHATILARQSENSAIFAIRTPEDLEKFKISAAPVPGVSK